MSVRFQVFASKQINIPPNPDIYMPLLEWKISTTREWIFFKRIISLTINSIDISL